MKQKICFITGSRAEYDLLYHSLLAFKHDKQFDLSIVVTGMHLEKKYGYTYKNILKDGFKISKKIKILSNNNDAQGVTQAVSKGFKKFGIFFKKFKPDLIVVLGDRYELLAPVYTANIFRIPVCHIHGGELSEGVIDENTRHAISKLSNIHFVAHKDYKRNLLQMGEDEKKIFIVGGLGVENLKKIKILSKKKIESLKKFKFLEKNILVTFHPLSLKENSDVKQLENLLSSLKKLKKTRIIFTMPNSDTNNDIFFKKIYKFISDNNNAISFKSLGSQIYLSISKNVDFVIGNSSSGLLEVPSLRIPTINIGERQNLRLKASSVIDCKSDSNSINFAIKKAYSKNFKKIIKKTKNPYDNQTESSKKILKILKKINYNNLLIKKFKRIKWQKKLF